MFCWVAYPAQPTRAERLGQQRGIPEGAVGVEQLAGIWIERVVRVEDYWGQLVRDHGRRDVVSRGHGHVICRPPVEYPADGLARGRGLATCTIQLWLSNTNLHTFTQNHAYLATTAARRPE